MICDHDPGSCLRSELTTLGPLHSVLRCSSHPITSRQLAPGPNHRSTFRPTLLTHRTSPSSSVCDRRCACVPASRSPISITLRAYHQSPITVRPCEPITNQYYSASQSPISITLRANHQSPCVPASQSPITSHRASLRVGVPRQHCAVRQGARGPHAGEDLWPHRRRRGPSRNRLPAHHGRGAVQSPGFGG